VAGRYSTLPAHDDSRQRRIRRPDDRVSDRRFRQQRLHDVGGARGRLRARTPRRVDARRSRLRALRRPARGRRTRDRPRIAEAGPARGPRHRRLRAGTHGDGVQRPDDAARVGHRTGGSGGWRVAGAGTVHAVRRGGSARRARQRRLRQVRKRVLRSDGWVRVRPVDRADRVRVALHRCGPRVDRQEHPVAAQAVAARAGLAGDRRRADDGRRRAVPVWAGGRAANRIAPTPSITCRGRAPLRCRPRWPSARRRATRRGRAGRGRRVATVVPRPPSWLGVRRARRRRRAVRACARGCR
jgi:hypothetical protein